MLKQHIGSPCKPIVEIGEIVNRGQLIAIPSGLGARIHSSVTGKITCISDSEIIIIPDENQTNEYIKIKKTQNHLEAIEEAGVVGAGGAGFPTYVKYSSPIKGGYIIANAAECEPILNHNIRLLEEAPELVVKGIKYAMGITGAEKGYVAIKPIYKKALIAVGRACKEESNIEVKLLSNIYPVGDERVIIRELLGKVLEPGQLPIEMNAIVSNVETLKNVALAIEHRKPVIDKDITVGGRLLNAKRGCVFLNQPIGTPIKKFIDKSGGYVKPYGEIVVGGPFTGLKAYETTALTKTSGGILVSMPFPSENRKIGLIECECGASIERLNEIALGMGAKVVATTECKRMVEVNGRLRCDKPGECPGQAEKVLSLKKEGAEVILSATCED